jgi:hypothetical protein
MARELNLLPKEANEAIALAKTLLRAVTLAARAAAKVFLENTSE